MGWPTAKRPLVISALLIGCGLVVCGWQVQEHLRFRRTATQALINRGRDITSTLGVLLRSQRRFGVVPKERLEATLQDLLRPDDLAALAILGATGETIASAGTRLELTPEMSQARGVFWRDRTLTILNLMDLGATAGNDGAKSRPPLVIADERTVRSLRPNAAARRAAEARANQPAEPGVPGTSPAPTAPERTAREATPSLYSRPSWMTKEEYDNVIQKQGVHSLLISLSTDEMHRAVNSDLLLRLLVSLFAMGGAVVSAVAWRNFGKNTELQIRLVKAGEMNTHLKELNLTAAGLAHETRNPLNLIRGLAQMISMQAKDATKLKEHAATIIEEADRVTVQLNEFINYSKPREPQFAPVQVARLVADVARTLVPDLEEKRITLSVPDSTLTISADELLLRQALFNVLLNATQAVGPGGHITVRLSPAAPGEAVLEIEDDGPGVPAGDCASIFKPYVTMRPKGVGLGLAIVAQIAAAHRWEVACLANEPHGARFRFSHLAVVSSPT
jgi:signal transduction histidine kinase